MDNEEIRLSKRMRVELASQYIEGLPTLRTGGFAGALRHWAQSWASLSILRAHSPEADLASWRRRTVPRTATEGTAARKLEMLDPPHVGTLATYQRHPLSLTACFQSGSDSIARPKMALQVVFVRAYP